MVLTRAQPYRPRSDIERVLHCGLLQSVFSMHRSSNKDHGETRKLSYRKAGRAMRPIVHVHRVQGKKEATVIFWITLTNVDTVS